MSDLDLPLQPLSALEFESLRLLLQLPADERLRPWFYLGDETTARSGPSAMGAVLFHRRTDDGPDFYSIHANPDNPIWITLTAIRMTFAQTVIVRDDDEALACYEQFVRDWHATEGQRLLLPPHTSGAVVMRTQLVSFMLQHTATHGALPGRLVELIVGRALAGA